jgi:type I restriction enzyme S subunit
MIGLKKIYKRRNLPNGWKEVRIADVFKTGSGATPTASNPAYYTNGTIPWINSGELNSATISEPQNFITQSGYENSSTKMYPKDTVLVAMYGATAGKTSILKIPACTNQAICAILPHKDFSPLFVKYYIENLYSHLVSLSSGSARDNISQDTIKELKIYCPSTLEGQMRLIEILNLIDRKIALNREINRNLEAMARQLYDYWFVQFDFPDENDKPYKSSGGKMVWNERLKREIPENWIVEDLSNAAQIFNGATPSTANEFNYGGNIVWITPKDLSDQQCKFVYYGARNISQKGYDSCSTHLLPRHSLLMSSRAPIGLLSISEVPLCTNQGFKSFVPKEGYDVHYLYYVIKHQLPKIEQLGTGTTFKEVSREDLMKFPILRIPHSIQKMWQEKTECMAERQYKSVIESDTLKRERDELLPLLMNGQVSVMPTEVNCDLSHD